MPKARQTQPEMSVHMRDVERRLAAVEAKVVRPAAVAGMLGRTMHMIKDPIVLGSNNQTLCQFTGIPADLTHLRLVWSGSSVGGSLQNVQVFFNNDTGASNYQFAITEDGVATQNTANNAIIPGRLGSSAGNRTAGYIDLLDYTNTAVFLSTISHSHATSGSDVRDISGVGVWLNNTAAVNQINVTSSSVSVIFQTGSRAWLYGW